MPKLHPVMLLCVTKFPFVDRLIPFPVDPVLSTVLFSMTTFVPPRLIPELLLPPLVLKCEDYVVSDFSGFQD